MAALVLNVSEGFNTADRFLKRPGAVIGDIAIKNTDMTQAQFQALLQAGGAAGYSTFRSMIEGDYEYQKAIVKVSFESQGGHLPRLNLLELSVDLPDISDAGAATLGAANTRVDFNRTFTAAPQVVATQIGGAGIGGPRITSVDATGFYVELVNASNSLIAGTISWRASGY